MLTGSCGETEGEEDKGEVNSVVITVIFLLWMLTFLCHVFTLTLRPDGQQALHETTESACPHPHVSHPLLSSASLILLLSSYWLSFFSDKEMFRMVLKYIKVNVNVLLDII